MTVRDLQEWVHQTALEHGWWDQVDKHIVPEKLMLIVSEVSEAMECYRSGQMEISYNEEGKPEGFASELADAVIRILDLAEYLEIDLENAIKIKAEYNETRPYRHGDKIA